MPDSFRASRDVIVRTEQFAEAVRFYESVLGLAVVHRAATLVGFDAGAFPFIRRARSTARARIRFPGPGHEGSEARAAVCRVRYR